MPPPRITDRPSPAARVGLPDTFGTRFLVTVDTEEEFDWGQPLRATGHTLHSVPRLARFQDFCEAHGVVPLYLVDYPIATSPLAAQILGPAVREGRAEVGVQLHPWVNPPFEEDVTPFTSFAGNLPPELERAKFARLRDAIEHAFGKAPQIYRAGRYGVGPHTAQILRDHGIAIDTSARAQFDYSTSGGPNFRDLPVWPWWVDQPGSLMELPLTTVYAGILGRWGPWLYPRLWRVPRLRGALARIGLLDRIPLTPEGVTAPEMRRAVAIALEQQVPVLVFSFHSPSLEPGHTPYVRTESDLDTLYGWWEAAFAELKAHGVPPTSVAQILAAAELA